MYSEEVLILRDERESARKCSLTPLRGMKGIRFVEYQPEKQLLAPGRILLHPGGDLLGPLDEGRGLLVIDCAWRRVPALLATIGGTPNLRRLPALRTAYPRKSRIFADPGEGLASVEAIYAALLLLGRPRPELLASYRFRDQFLAANAGLLG
jgi:pre-rRNA-processing protein TSR3